MTTTYIEVNNVPEKALKYHMGIACKHIAQSYLSVL